MQWKTIEEVLKLLFAAHGVLLRDQPRLRLTFDEMRQIPPEVRSYWAPCVVQEGGDDILDTDYRVIRSRHEWRLERVSMRESYRMAFAKNEKSFVEACRFAKGFLHSAS